MTDEDVRIEALTKAAQCRTDHDSDEDIVRRAKAFYGFLNGE